MSASKRLSRAVYTGNLRRAFLLRAHPDRFRNHDTRVRKRQSALLSVLGERMMESDFQHYMSNTRGRDLSLRTKNAGGFKYFLEGRDGNLILQELDLGDAPFDILNSMVKALESSGVASVNPPPPPPTELIEAAVGDITWINQTSGAQAPGIDHQFDVHSNKGRNLLHFLRSVDQSEIQRRRDSRLDVSAAALVARRLYSFQAIDGVKLGWSSASLTKVLRSLIQLHEEHHSKFLVGSFYPLRLVFSKDELQSPLDVYSGTLYLHPALTQTQWLHVLQRVTADRIRETRENRTQIESLTVSLQNSIGVKLKKGLSCSAKEYYAFLKEASNEASLLVSSSYTSLKPNCSNALEVERLVVVVESSHVTRRGKVNNTGQIQVGSGMTWQEVNQSIGKLEESARGRFAEEKLEKEQCDQLIDQIQWELGIQKVTRAGLVTRSNFLKAMQRLQTNDVSVKQLVAGFHSLGVSGRGHFCRIGDDGGLILPCDFI